MEPNCCAHAHLQLSLPGPAHQAPIPESRAVQNPPIFTDALRVQAAALAAQQAALTEEEIRLQKRLGALAQQETQLSAHLEEKRRKLVLLHEKAQAERASLKNERTGYEQFVAHLLGDLTQAQRELLENHQKVQAERKRLTELHRRLRQRWQRHWAVEKQKFQLREEELANEECNQAQENDRLKEEQAALAQERLRFNGEYELGRRQLHQAWTRLREAQGLWRRRRRKERAALSLRARDLEQTEVALFQTQKLLQQEQDQWHRQRLHLEKEVEGLNRRISHQREIIFQHQQEIGRLEALVRERRPLREEKTLGLPFPENQGSASAEEPDNKESSPGGEESSRALVVPTGAVLALPPPIPAEPVTTPVPDIVPEEDCYQRRLAELDRLAGDLADQRLQLLEQWERLAQTQHQWEQARQQAIADLENLGWRLKDQEQGLIVKEQFLRASEETLRKKHGELVHLRQHIVGWRARLRARETSWETERNQRLIEIRHREELLAHHFQALTEIRQRWAKERRREVEKIREQKVACENLRSEYAALRQEWHRRWSALEQEKRILTERNLALEQLRQEVFKQSGNALAAERRVERLRRRWLTQNAQAIRVLSGDREALQEELSNLEARFAELQKRSEEVAGTETAFAEKQKTWEHKQTLLAVHYRRQKQELKTARAQNTASEQQLSRLKEQVEHIAMALLDEPDPPSLSAEKAA